MKNKFDTSERPAIHAAMAAILADVGAVEKGRKNPSQGYNYRGIDDALTELHPLFAKHKVYLQLVGLAPVFSEAGKTSSGKVQFRCVLTGTVRFVSGVDGSSTEAAIVGEGIDTTDKALMKALANGLKYVLWYSYAIPTEEKLDSEAYADEPTQAQEEEKPKRQRARTSAKKEDAPAQQEKQVVEPTAESATLLKKGQDLLAALKKLDTAEALLNMRLELRTWAEAAKAVGKALTPIRQEVIDEFQAQQSRLGA